MIHRHLRKVIYLFLFDKDAPPHFSFRQLTEYESYNVLPHAAYATSMNTVISTAYEMFNRKLFSLPKVLLLPGVMSRQPLLVAQVFPFIFLSDWLKAYVVTYMTTKIESLQKEIQEISAVRSKVESFDIKNAELLQRSGKDATRFTQQRWEKLTIQVQSRQIISELLGRGKGFFAFMQRNFIFTVLIDCALANLIAIGKIIPAEIFVYSRVSARQGKTPIPIILFIIVSSDLTIV
jgi:hypothetical protein